MLKYIYLFFFSFWELKNIFQAFTVKGCLWKVGKYVHSKKFMLAAKTKQSIIVGLIFIFMIEDEETVSSSSSILELYKNIYLVWQYVEINIGLS